MPNRRRDPRSGKWKVRTAANRMPKAAPVTYLPFDRIDFANHCASRLHGSGDDSDSQLRLDCPSNHQPVF